VIIVSSCDVSIYEGLRKKGCSIFLRISLLLTFEKNKHMSVETQKQELIEWLRSVKDQSLLEKIQFLKDHPKASADWWESISESAKLSIDRGLEDVAKSKTKPHSEIRKKYAKWV